MTEHYVIFSAPTNPVTANNLVTLLNELATLKATRVTIAMNCSGGDVIAGMFMYNSMIAMPYKIITHNIGNIDSMGTVLFLAGSERLSCVGGTFMFHGVGFNTVNERLEDAHLRNKLDTLTADTARMTQVITARTKITPAEATDLFKQQKTVDAQWAKDKGIVSAVQDFSLPANAATRLFLA